jgi:hypothetical protein
MSDRRDVGMAPAATIAGGHRAALAGVVFAVLFVLGFALLDQVPKADASDADLDEFYAGTGSQVLVVAAFYIVPFAGIAFLWFLGALRHRVQNLAGTEDTLLATVQLLSGVLFVAMTFTSAAAGAATAAAIEIGGESVPSATETRQMLAFAQTATLVFALRTAAVFVAAGTTRAHRAGLFPRWFTVASYALTLVLLLATTFFRPVVVLFPAWVAIVSILVLRRVPLGSGRSSSGPA